MPVLDDQGLHERRRSDGIRGRGGFRIPVDERFPGLLRAELRQFAQRAADRCAPPAFRFFRLGMRHAVLRHAQRQEQFDQQQERRQDEEQEKHRTDAPASDGFLRRRDRRSRAANGQRWVPRLDDEPAGKDVRDPDDAFGGVEQDFVDQVGACFGLVLEFESFRAVDGEHPADAGYGRRLVRPFERQPDAAGGRIEFHGVGVECLIVEQVRRFFERHGTFPSVILDWFVCPI